MTNSMIKGLAVSALLSLSAAPLLAGGSITPGGSPDPGTTTASSSATTTAVVNTTGTVNTVAVSVPAGGTTTTTVAGRQVTITRDVTGTVRVNNVVTIVNGLPNLALFVSLSYGGTLPSGPAPVPVGTTITTGAADITPTSTGAVDGNDG